VFNDPKEFALSAMPPESMALEIAGQGIQLGASWSFAISVRSMTGETSALSVVNRLTLVDYLRRIR
jgi:hypothetical protein